MRRIAVIGCSGSGKSTVATALAARLGCPQVELDALFHQPGWTPLPTEEFRAQVRAVVDGDDWVVDGNYFTKVGDLVWARADTVVWLDLPRGVVLRSVISRSLRRVVSREELWNSNRERWWNLLDPRPEENIILWAWTRHGPIRRRYAAAITDPRWSDVRFVRLRSRAEVTAWLEDPTGL